MQTRTLMIEFGFRNQTAASSFDDAVDEQISTAAGAAVRRLFEGDFSCDLRGISVTTQTIQDIENHTCE